MILSRRKKDAEQQQLTGTNAADSGSKKKGQNSKRAKKKARKNSEDDDGVELFDLPRGRIGAQTWIANDELYVLGGSCESGDRKEFTLDDLWRFDLDNKLWRPVLSLSERALGEDESSSEEEDEAVKMPEWAPVPKKIQFEEKKREKNPTSAAAPVPEASSENQVSLIYVTDPSKLSKKELEKWKKKQRSEAKAVKQLEKEDKKNNKKDAKVTKQKATGNKSKKEADSI